MPTLRIAPAPGDETFVRPNGSIASAPSRIERSVHLNHNARVAHADASASARRFLGHQKD